eukprot:CAMPEP_0113482450 /NCGR_PEP_ID=MMETSP0014_2-20120614/22925_1 /TAXON_ID=2857 /ORGANISM="Nitzschia sp." /LENGTH=375 /DNA_ID=CAMNT_0000375967 /DNA_START=355 /DNA_END=1482 /DNA_ORIENTATION=- /assembly_acc=CAM_ASM_000159
MATSTVQHLARRFLEAAASVAAAAAAAAAAATSETTEESSNSNDANELLSSSPPSSLLSSSSTPIDLFSTTSSQTSNMTMNFLNDTVAMVLNNDGGDSNNDDTTFDPKVFWSVNAFILALFLTTICCCCFGKKEWLDYFVYDHESGRETSDMQYRRSVLQRQQRQQQSKVETPAQRTKKLLRSFRRHQVEMTVTEDDIVDDEDHLPDVELGNGGGGATPVAEENSPDDDDDSMQETGRLRLKNGSLVPNCCAICLMSYDVGDKVIWSSNPNCAHAFHQDCVVGWLVKMQPETPCPCCRQEFTDLETLRKERKIKWGPDHAFNPSLVSFSPPTGTTIELPSSETSNNNEQTQSGSADTDIRTNGSSSTGGTNEETV